MKKYYFFAFAFAGLTQLSAQVQSPLFTELKTPVVIDGQNSDFPMLYEAAAAWGDYDNDGYLDLLLSGVGAEGVQTLLFKNNGGNSFTKIATTFPGLRSSNATWFDYNNDGNLDLFLAGKKEDGSLYSGLWKNKGNDAGFEEVFMGTFPQINNGDGNKSNRYVIAADYDGDGWTDLYVQGRTEGGDKNKGIAYLFRNVNGESFERIDKPVKNKMSTGDAKPFIQLSGGGAAWADYDGDGFVDLLVSGEGIDADKYDADYGYHGSYNGAVYKNNGDGTFAEPIEFKGTEEGNAVWLDYDNNGKLDFAVAGVRWDEDASWNWRGDLYVNGAQGFTSYASAVTGLPGNKQSVSLDAGDANNDGFSDILYLNATDAADAIYLNNGGGTEAPMFTASPLAYGDQAAQRGGTANFVDFDNDGNLDAFLVGYADAQGSHARLMKNELGNGITANQAPGLPTNLKVSPGSNGIVMFSWDAPEDDTTPSAALKYNLYIKQGDVVRMTVPADLTTGRLKVSEVSGLISKRVLYKVSGLTGEYTWGVQAIDNAKAAGKFVNYNSTGITESSATTVKVFGDKEVIRISTTQMIDGTVNVYSIDGVNVYARTGELNNEIIRLKKGIYLVNITTSNQTITEKVIVK
ncbi:VCBS repeat-containing protein [Oscillospiraceae bacterium N12]|jgi:hypothetical protein|uniref:VCBS repeat-containing protein n=1 Tax=Jilunia laotingensis TaxID=2763675 RepID=A0A926IQ46_9BACT|nr:FG-GAP-like repeat-containing protein [Jilunia laotingensis]MBC8593954.1 VCBS repeat-containing protein [Jilunia laotingensis]